MKIAPVHLPLFFALAAFSLLRADPLGPLAEDATPVLNAICKSHATGQSRAQSPSSQLTPEQALSLAASLTQLYGKDIIISRVAPTGSMRPYFDENALLLLEAVPFSELRLGDVVTFHHPHVKTDVVHRLVEKRNGVFWTKGDHNITMDDVYVTPENFHRRLVGVIYMRPDSPKPPVPPSTATMAALPAVARTAAR